MQQYVHPVEDVIRLDNGRESAAVKNKRSLTGRNNVSVDISADIIRDTGNFNALQSDWNKIAQPSGNLLLQFPWYSACAEAFSSLDQLHTIVLRREGEVTAIAPLREITRGGLKRLEIIGSTVLCEPVGLLFKDDESLIALTQTILSEKKPFLTGRVDVASPENDVFRLVLGRHRSVRFHHATYSPWLPITTNWEDFQKSISSSRRSAMRRAQRRAHECGTVTMEVLSPGVNEVQRLLDETYDVEHASWKARTKTSIRSNPQMEKFFNLYGRKMANAGAMRISLMRIDGEAVAAQIGVEYAGRFWVLKVGYDERFAHCSPGILLMHHTVQYAFERSLKTFEFLGRNEPWIRIWTEKTHEYNSYWHYPANAAGIMWLVQDGTKILTTKLTARVSRKIYVEKN